MNSAVFNGSSNYLSIANFTGNPAAFSVSCWINLTANQTQRTYFSNFQSSGSKGWVSGISDSLTNKIKLYLGGNTLTSATALVAGIWTHVVCTHDGTTAKIYLNGNATPDATLTSAIAYGTIPANNYIGAEPAVSQFIAGSLAAVGYWNKALSTTEVSTLFNSGNGLLFAGLSGSLLTSLQAYYDFASSGNLGLDSSSGAHNMSNTGSVTWSNSGPFNGPAANVRLTQEPVRVLILPTDTKERITQEPVRVLVLPTDTKERVTQEPVRVLIRPTDTKERVTQLAVRVLRLNAPAAPKDNASVILAQF